MMLALVLAPVALIGMTGPLSAAVAAEGTVITSQTLSADTTWTTAGSPYVVQNSLKVASGVRLTIEPGVIVKIGNPDSRGASISVSGQLIARGTAGSPVVFTSYRDDSFGGDSNGDGSATAPAPGDWYHIYFSGNGSTRSVIDRAIVQYGGYGSGRLCSSYSLLNVATGGSLSVTNSDLRYSQYTGISVSSSAGSVHAGNNRFFDSGCGVHARQGSFSENVFEASITSNAAQFSYPKQVKFYDNYVGKPVYVAASPGPTREQVDFRGNALVAGVRDQPFDYDAKDLAYNWWGRELEADPDGCYDHDATYIPAYSYKIVNGSACYNSGKPDIAGYFTKVIPALAEAPPIPAAGVTGARTFSGTVPDEQVFGPDGGSDFAPSPTGSQADPVNTAIGAFTYTETDTSLSSATQNLAVNRFYTSQDGSEGPFGRGWSLGYDLHLTFQDPEVELKTGTGQRVRFSKAVDGSYTGPPGTTAGLTRKDDGTYVARTRSGLTHVFDSSGKLLTLTDSSGRGPALSYDDGGRLTRVSDGDRWISFTWDAAAGRITGVETSAGQTVTYSYENGLLTGVRDAAGGTTRYTYDSGGRLSEITTPAGRTVVRTAYDDTTGRVTDQWDGMGQHFVFAWDPASSTATMTDPRGGVWKDVYAGNVIQRRVDPTGATTQYEYDENLRLVATHAPNGVRNAMGYTAGGDVKSFQGTTPLVVSQYNDQHLPTSTTNARGATSSMAYDGANNLTQLTRPNPAGGSLSDAFAYDAMGNLTAATDAKGNTSRFEYSTDGDLTKTISPLGSIQSMTYDSAGRVTSVTSPRGNQPGADPAQHTWRYEYDALGRPTKATNPAGHTETVAYDPDGLVTQVTDTQGRTSRYEYDAAGRLTAAYGPDAAVPPTTTTYDANGNVTATTDAMGRTTSFAYDAANRATSVTMPLGTYTITYTSQNQIATVKDPKGALTTFRYDTAGRLVGSDQPGTDADVTYTYDANGNRASMKDATGTTTYTYDVLDRLTTVTRSGRTFTLGYDEASNLTSLKSPDGAVTTYVHDADGQVTQVKTGDQVLAEYTYDADGNTTGLTRADGSAAKKTYDHLGRLTRITDTTAETTLLEETYAYDQAGNPTSITHGNGEVDTFSYDALDRLVKACYDKACDAATEVLEWSYDHADNILTETRTGQTTRHDYNALGQRTRTTDPTGTVTNYTYDYRGQALTAGDRSFTYTNAGRTASVKTPEGTTTYTYDGDGRRLSAKTAAGTTTFEWDPFYRLTNELDGAGALIRHYTHGEELLSVTDATATSTYFHTDRLGSIRSVTDATGAQIDSYAWEPFGRPRATGPSAPNAPPSPMGWLGQYQDPTGLIHLRARQYDPAAGSFLQTDPATTTAISGLYSYAAANPMVFTDIYGLWATRGTLTGIQNATSNISTVATAVAAVTAVTGIGAPIAAAAAGVALATAAASAGAAALLAHDTCTNGAKGACSGAIATAALAAAAIPPGGKLIKGAATGAKAANTAFKAPQVLRVGDVKLSAVPKGTVGTPTQKGRGMEYSIPPGTPELSERVTSVRIMDPVTSGKYQHPNGYAVYMNSSGQTINPLTGETIANSHPFAHIPLP